MPSATPDGERSVCDCPPNFCRETRHKTARSAAFASGASKSISLMSGGERTWIDACMTRAIALYLTQHSGRHYATLFSDEADGPLDPEHKRMFMAMKREVLRLGGYEREYFITQTPQLAAMADAVIDLDLLCARRA
jgi:exonuclease SbcC